ncbi:MAG: tetratricopeptide repeat protein [Proteobacteria bacterium]|nr:tetratricopeptide repeat protein [Pseudomonadota bacterium]MBU1612239.1 tetratricopeptide repeat protein [Pseudomonadota bacterium]
MSLTDNIVMDFLTNPVAAVPIISDDESFKKNLKAVFQKSLGIKREVVHSFQQTTQALKYLDDRLSKGYPTVLFCEGTLNGRATSGFLATIKSSYPELKVIALVSEIRRDDIAYLYEVGCDNVIAKPASANNVLEKMANAIKPQGQLSKYVSVAKSLLRSGENDKVLVVCKKILELKPGSPAALMLAGDAYLAEGDRPKALVFYEKAHKSSEVYLEPIKRLVDFYRGYDDGMYLHYMEILDKLSPLHAERKKDIGVVYLDRGDQPVAELYFDKAMECADREASNIVAGMAESIARAVQDCSPYMAEKYLSQALDAKQDSLTREDLETFNRLGIALKAQGKWKEAVECYRKALGIAPKDEGLHYNMGMALFEGRRSMDAHQAFCKALALNPALFRGNGVVSTNLANAFYEAGDYAKGLEFAAHALELNPTNKNAAQLVERLKARVGKA